jgi:GT2 family glycosyltransferase
VIGSVPGTPDIETKTFLPWKIVDLSVRECLPDLNAEPGCGGLFLVFWCDRIPVGRLSIPARLLPLTASQLTAIVPSVIAPAVGNRILSTAFPRFAAATADPAAAAPELALLVELERPLARCSESIRRRTGEGDETIAPLVSLVICTRNRPESLAICLTSLRHLSPQPGEIVVVDNDPSSGVTRAVTAGFSAARYVAEPQPGLSAARNTGIRSCRGTVIAFTDDDVTVHPDWIGVLEHVFDDPGVMAATGLVLPAELATPAQLAFEREALWDLRATDFDQAFFSRTRRHGVPAWQLGAGANMAFRREAFERVGVFDERLGAGASGCSEDSELWYRLLTEGYRCRFEPAAVVFHTHRRDAHGLTEQTYSYMRGHVAALLFQFDRYGHWGNLYRAFVALPADFLKLALRAFQRSLLTGGIDQSSPALPLGAQIGGAVAGYGYYLRHRWRRAHPAQPDRSDVLPSAPPAWERGSR